MSTHTKRIAIVGGGIAGLAAAWELSRQIASGAAAEVTLFEASPRLGGIVETVHQQGFTIECGPDAWVSEKPWARQAAIELGLDDELIASNDADRKTWLLLEGRLVEMPARMRLMVPEGVDALEAIDRSPLFSAAAKSAYRAEPGRAAELKALAPAHDESIAALVLRHFGEEVLRKLAGPLLSGIFGGDVARLSARAIMPAFVAMEREHGSLILGLEALAAHGKQADGRRPASPPAIFTTLKAGLGGLIDAMSGAIPSHSIRLHQPVRAVAREGERWRISSSCGTEAFDALLMAAPVHVAQALLRPVDSRMAALMQMDATSAIVVALGFHQPEQVSRLPVSPGFGFLVPPGSRLSLLACTFMDQKFPHRVPHGGRLLRAFFGGQAALDLACRTDAEILSLARIELGQTLGTTVLPDPGVAVVRRWPSSLPQYAPGHLDRMAALEVLRQGQPQLHLLGNGYRGVGLPDLIRDARAAARACIQDA